MLEDKVGEYKMNDSQRADIIRALYEYQEKSFNTRRQYEWKVFFGFIVGISVVSYYLLQTSIITNNIWVASIATCTLSALLITVLKWLSGIAIRLKVDTVWMKYYRKVLETIAMKDGKFLSEDTELIKLKEEAIKNTELIKEPDKDKEYNWYDNWSNRLQGVFLIIFILTLIAFVWFHVLNSIEFENSNEKILNIYNNESSTRVD